MKPGRWSPGQNNVKTVLRSIVTASFIAAAVLLFTIGVLAPALPAVVGPPLIEEERGFVESKALALHLLNADGAVRIRTHDQDEMRFAARVRVYARQRSAAKEVRAYAATLFDVSRADGTLTITTEPLPRPDVVELRVDYEVCVPTATDVEIENANGNVWIEDGCRAVTVLGHNADVEIQGPSGPVSVQSANGRVRLTGARQGATLATVNGNIYAHMLGGALDAATANGIILTRVLTDAVGDCTLKSQNGGITLVLHGKPAGVVSAATETGMIRAGVPVDTSAGVASRKTLKGVIGEGERKLTVETLNGNIWITRNTE